MGLAQTFLKWKRIIIVVIVVLVILALIRAFRLKKDVFDMLKTELHLADSVSKSRSSKDTSSQDSLVSFLTRASKLVKLEVPASAAAFFEDSATPALSAEKEKPAKSRAGVRRKGSKTSSYKREELCRAILEEYFDDYFPSCRPKFLTNPETGRALELDGYNAANSLAFEHSGKQHYEYPNSFHKTEEEFLKQQERDEFKRQRCAELQIALLEIPYTVPTEQLKPFILGELKRLGY